MKMMYAAAAFAIAPDLKLETFLALDASQLSVVSLLQESLPFSLSHLLSLKFSISSLVITFIGGLY